jgi:polyhydroxybutyrate depolymerase
VRHSYALAFVAILALGCSTSPSGESGTAGSSAGGISSGGTGPASGSGGMVATGGGSAGSNATAGNNPVGGAAGTAAGGSGTGGVTGGSGGQAGASTAGAGGAGSGGAAAVVPSAGCGKAGRPANGEVSVPNDRIYDFPTTYDGTKPFPAVIALHGANNPNTILQMLSKGSRLETEFVLVFPKSNGSAWQYNNGTGPDMTRIGDIYTELLANYCVDTNRIFLMGHSSGAQMSVHMMCAAGGDKRFKAYAPVAASKYCDTLTPAPVMYIQGMMDAQRGGGNGKDVVDVFVASNKCMAQSMPDAAVPPCNSTFDQKPVTPGCVTYQGCTEPTIWCSHNDNGYNLTDGHMHGWPCFASNAIADFFLGLP